MEKEEGYEISPNNSSDLWYHHLVRLIIADEVLCTGGGKCIGTPYMKIIIWVVSYTYRFPFFVVFLGGKYIYYIQGYIFDYAFLYFLSAMHSILIWVTPGNIM